MYNNQREVILHYQLLISIGLIFLLENVRRFINPIEAPYWSAVLLLNVEVSTRTKLLSVPSGRVGPACITQ